jgi:hypothetical protein
MGDLTLKQRWRKMADLAILRTLPPCKEIVQIISASLDRPLTLRERLVMKLHLVACRPCQRYLAQSEFLQTATHHLDDELKDDLLAGRLSDEARERIKTLLKVSPS